MESNASYAETLFAAADAFDGMANGKYPDRVLAMAAMFALSEPCWPKVGLSKISWSVNGDSRFWPTVARSTSTREAGNEQPRSQKQYV